MDIFSVFTLLGGLALFLYGMNLMGAGLDKLAGGKLERLLERLTSNPIKSVIFGAVVTAIIQSSSATTVMVVGFVNSGIMKLSQAIGIIMGANLGTTATAWILSLSGLEGDNFVVKIFKPTTFAPILAFIGIILFMMAKKERKKEVGTILIGFAILMFGMESMSDSVKPLAEVPEFANLLVMFSNPLLGVLTGALLTAIIQSSSASVGILQALSVTGGITYASAVPIILGQNIGTCVTAMISGIGANKNARRAALVHLYFNIIGSALFLALFYLIQYTIGFPFINDSVDGFSIAVIHTLFNLISTAALLPFSKGLEKLACLTIKDGSSNHSEQDEIRGIDERFLNTPSYAVDQCCDLVKKMALISKENFLRSLEQIKMYDEKRAQDIISWEDKIDKYEDVLGTFLVKLSSKNLSETDAKAVSVFLHVIGDFERIGDHAVNISKTGQEIMSKKIKFSDDADKELSVIINAVTDVLDKTTLAFETNDLALCHTIEPLEEVIDYLRKEIRDRHIRRLQAGNCTTELGFVYTDLLTNLERVSDHCSNIAVCMIQVDEASFDTHEYLHNLKYTGGLGFKEQFEANKERYKLPENK